jgi:hypothetical protein
MTKITRIQHTPGVHFIFLTENRKPTSHEALDLTEKYFGVHLKRTQASEALLVDLRPAFSVPLSDVTPKFEVVPIDYTPPPE